MSDPGRPAEVLTIMITDVEGSTAFRQIRGDRVTDEILRLHQVIVRGQLRRYRGWSTSSLATGSSR
jgi:class 3 adenylate cyclase